MNKEAITACNKQIHRSEQENPCIKRQHGHKHKKSHRKRHLNCLDIAKNTPEGLYSSALETIQILMHIEKHSIGYTKTMTSVTTLKKVRYVYRRQYTEGAWSIANTWIHSYPQCQP